MKTIDPLHLEALYGDGKPIELIDVRPQDEFDRLHVLGSRSVPLRELAHNQFLKPRRLSPDQPLYIICRSGVLAKLAAEDLAEGGFDNSIIVEGGIDAWAHLGLPVVRQRSTGTALRIAMATVITIAMAAAIFSREFLIALPLLIALGVIALDLIESHQTNLKVSPC